MRISFSPQRRDDTLAVSRQGDALAINGDVFDFATLPDGATIAAENSPSPWITGPVERIDSKLHLTLLLPHGSSPSNVVAFPEPLIDPDDGPLDLPFSDWNEMLSAKHNGDGIIETYIAHRWGHPDEVRTNFIPDPEEPEDDLET